MKPKTLSIVSYYNTIPLVYGLEQFMPKGLLRIEKDEPNICARKLIEGSVDLALVPVGALVGLTNYHILTDYCIGAEGKVLTVGLFSHCELHRLKQVFLDPHSRTSNILVRILAQQMWGISPGWINPVPGYENLISHTTGGVIIGNRVFDNIHRFPVAIDLAQAWLDLTNLPFVFACFASTKPLPQDFLVALNEAMKLGVANTSEAIAATGIHFPFDIHNYLTNNIKFNLDDNKRVAMNLFISKASNIDFS